MRSLLILAFALSAAACAQTSGPQLVATLTLDALPDAPSAVLEQQQDVVVLTEASQRATGTKMAPCSLSRAVRPIPSDPKTIEQVGVPCSTLVNPHQRFLDTDVTIPLTARQKGYLALHNLTAPSNLLIIVTISGFAIGIDSHSAYGPGLKGFGKNVGVSLLQATTGEFFGTFLVPAITHQDPRYYRMPEASFTRRFVHALSRTVVANNDDGHLMPNYGTLLSYPINAELSNLYVPGIHSDASSTVARIATGLATDPANNLIEEFLPDVAKHINIRVVFIQRILNQIASQSSGTF